MYNLNFLKKVKKGIFLLKRFGFSVFLNKFKDSLLALFNLPKFDKEIENYIKNLREFLNYEEKKELLSKTGFNNLEDLWEFVISFNNGLIAPMQIKEEFLELLKIFKQYNPKIILEIGSCKGGTLFCFCKLASYDATIISIDLPFWGSKKYHKYDYLIIQLFNCFKKDNQELHLIRGSSQDKNTVSYLEKLLNGRKIDFIFIDGDHSYEAVKKDFEFYSKFINKSGIIPFHDIAPKYTDGSSVFWNEIKNNKKKYNYIDYKEIIKDSEQDACGIGIFYF